jgi:hypothetical protein
VDGRGGQLQSGCSGNLTNPMKCGSCENLLSGGIFAMKTNESKQKTVAWSVTVF